MRLKKIAADCMSIAQTGQYNLRRCALRRETVTVHLVASGFIKAAAALAFHLQNRFAPYYKWLHRAVGELPGIGPALGEELGSFASAVDPDEQQHKADAICALLADELIARGLSDAGDDFFTYHINSKPF
jgi:hypothetical protein